MLLRVVLGFASSPAEELRGLAPAGAAAHAFGSKLPAYSARRVVIAELNL